MNHMYDARIFDSVSENAVFGPIHQLNLGKEVLGNAIYVLSGVCENPT